MPNSWQTQLFSFLNSTLADSWDLTRILHLSHHLCPQSSTLTVWWPQLFPAKIISELSWKTWMPNSKLHSTNSLARFSCATPLHEILVPYIFVILLHDALMRCLCVMPWCNSLVQCLGTMPWYNILVRCLFVVAVCRGLAIWSFSLALGNGFLQCPYAWSCKLLVCNTSVRCSFIMFLCRSLKLFALD